MVKLLQKHHNETKLFQLLRWGDRLHRPTVDPPLKCAVVWFSDENVWSQWPPTLQSWPSPASTEHQNCHDEYHVSARTSNARIIVNVLSESFELNTKLYYHTKSNYDITAWHVFMTVVTPQLAEADRMKGTRTNGHKGIHTDGWTAT